MCITECANSLNVTGVVLFPFAICLFHRCVAQIKASVMVALIYSGGNLLLRNELSFIPISDLTLDNSSVNVDFIMINIQSIN